MNSCFRSPFRPVRALGRRSGHPQGRWKSATWSGAERMCARSSTRSGREVAIAHWLTAVASLINGARRAYKGAWPSVLLLLARALTGRSSV
ncbi:hypothetical protein AOXY_G12030 [Acipenser oxyrinchus oxyrinchus]|uniref:Uncharacterized protein n=1 Tax=Acipenser oxyrinchus oxyrinchus TaxID=40147 RepID=A0AAD8DCT9_ACIOX|nr:hypothetical protein AOXY_G12030 [Acipenser oxyrinchus oxyrinchus]